MRVDEAHRNTISRMKPLILASASPRRHALLALTGWAFAVHTTHADETPLPQEDAVTFVRRMSETKAALCADQLGPRPALILACDTTVALDGDILNKPASAAEATAMLQRLRGRAHQVHTAITVLEADTGQRLTEVVTSRVPMRAYADDEIAAYVATGDPLDKAGAYAIQNSTLQPVERAAFADCFANVMGLPLCHVVRALRRWGWHPPADVPGACQAFIPYACPVFATILGEN